MDKLKDLAIALTFGFIAYWGCFFWPPFIFFVIASMGWWIHPIRKK